jgi:hypothetical protein
LDVYAYAVGEANAETMEELFMRRERTERDALFAAKLNEFFTEKYGAPQVAEWKAEGIAVGEARGIAVGEARGEAKGEAKAVLIAARTKFKKVPKWIEKAILSMTDSVALESLPGTCHRQQNAG